MRLNPPKPVRPAPTWPEVWQLTLTASAIGAVIQVALAAGSQQPSPVGTLAGAVAAASALARRGVRFRVIGTAAVIAGIAAGLFWAVLNPVHADRWATVPDALLCPAIAVGIAYLWVRRQEANTATDEAQ